MRSEIAAAAAGATRHSQVAVGHRVGNGRERRPHRNGHSAPTRALVLGGGVAGLYAGYVLARDGVEVTVLEKEPEVGGLAAGFRRQGNYYDMGVHHLHAFDEEIFHDIQDLMGETLLPVKKVAKIRYGRGYRRYPLEFADMLLGIPPWTLALAVGGLLWQSIWNRLRPFEPRNAEEALIQLYGRSLYRHFFKQFTTAYWGFPPTGLSAAFVRRKMPRLSAVDVLKKALSRFGLEDRGGSAVESALRDETLWYSRTGSREMPMALARGIEAHGGRVLTESPVVRLVVHGGRVVGAEHGNGPSVKYTECDFCISTIPLPALVGAVDPPVPATVIDAAKSLRYKAIAVYGLLVNKPQVLDALYVYFRDRIFHRVAEPRRSGLEVAPSGHTVLLAETTCEVGDAKWRGEPEIVRRIVADLEAENLIAAENVVEHHVLHTEHGYPIFSLGFERHLSTVTDHLEGIVNLRSTGRQGGFCYPNMHSAMRMGATAAQELLAQWEASRSAARSTSIATAPPEMVAPPAVVADTRSSVAGS